MHNTHRRRRVSRVETSLQHQVRVVYREWQFYQDRYVAIGLAVESFLESPRALRFERGVHFAVGLTAFGLLTVICDRLKSL